MKVSARQLLANLPSLSRDQAVERARVVSAILGAPRPKLVVLDDDPTGTQTVRDLPVLTTWEEAALAREFSDAAPAFYVLTNTRSLAADAAGARMCEIARHLRGAAAGRPFSVICRSDSTLRGHFPLETDIIAEELGPFDATLLVPFFPAGGRLTIDDVHYVREDDDLVPAAETPFAADASFGYRRSNLREWVEEKTRGRVRAERVQSIGLAELRRPGQAGIEALASRLQSFPSGSYVVLNAAERSDVDTLAAAVVLAERAGRRLLFRTAAEFVAAMLGQDSRPLLRPDEIADQNGAGGLIVAGSYVPQTTVQLERLAATGRVQLIELAVPALLDLSARSGEIARADAAVHAALAAGRDVLLVTSRQLIRGADATRSLEIGRQVSEALVTLVRQLRLRPRYLVAKGGITSSDLATCGLDVRRAMIRGQITPGVPVWQLGPECRLPGLRYVVFPGNVGGPGALVEVHRRLAAIDPQLAACGISL